MSLWFIPVHCDTFSSSYSSSFFLLSPLFSGVHTDETSRLSPLKTSFHGFPLTCSFLSFSCLSWYLSFLIGITTQFLMMNKKGQDEVRRDFHAGLEAMKNFLISGIGGGFSHLPLPPLTRSVLQYSAHGVYERGFLVDYDWLRYGIDFCYTIPSIKLFLHSVIVPIFESPNIYASKREMSPSSSSADDNVERDEKKEKETERWQLGCYAVLFSICMYRLH